MIFVTLYWSLSLCSPFWSLYVIFKKRGNLFVPTWFHSSFLFLFFLTLFLVFTFCVLSYFNPSLSLLPPGCALLLLPWSLHAPCLSSLTSTVHHSMSVFPFILSSLHLCSLLDISYSFLLFTRHLCQSFPVWHFSSFFFSYLPCWTQPPCSVCHIMKKRFNLIWLSSSTSNMQSLKIYYTMTTEPTPSTDENYL